MRTASGTVIQPSKTIIHDQYGRTTVIVIRPRLYLETGTEVSVGDRKFMDYAFPAGGDPGQSQFWFIGPDVSGSNGYRGGALSSRRARRSNVTAIRDTYGAAGDDVRS